MDATTLNLGLFTGTGDQQVPHDYMWAMSLSPSEMITKRHQLCSRRFIAMPGMSSISTVVGIDSKRGHGMPFPLLGSSATSRHTERKVCEAARGGCTLEATAVLQGRGVDPEYLWLSRSIAYGIHLYLMSVLQAGGPWELDLGR